MNKLNKTELKEPMFITWGRILTSVQFNGDTRLQQLIEKFNQDLKKAKIEEKTFVK